MADYISLIKLPDKKEYDIKAKALSNRTASSALTGTGTVGQYTNSKYYPAKWTFNSGADAVNGDIVTIKLPCAGHDYGVFMSVDNGTHYYPVVISGTGRVTTHYPSGGYITVIFNSSGSAANMFALAGLTSSTRITVSGGVWQVLNYYDSGNSGLYQNYNAKSYKVGTTAITAYDLIAEDINGYLVPAHKIAHRVGSPIFIRDGALAANATGSWASLYDRHYNLTIRKDGNNLSLTTYAPVFLKGSISGGIFTPDTTTPYVSTKANCNVTGAYYMYVGDATSGTVISFNNNHPYYYYNGTDLVLYTELAGNAATVNGLTVQTAVPQNALFTDKYHKTGSWSGLTYTATAVNSADALAFTIPTGTTATTVAVGNHTHGNITSDGKIGSTADYAVYTTTGGAVTAGSLATDSPTASGNATAFITSITLNSKGKITATKANLDTSGTWSGTANYAKYISGTIKLVADGALTTAPETGKILYYYNINKGADGLFNATSNANSILVLNRHSGNFDSQLGFSSDGRLYYRGFSGSALNNTTGWNKIAWISDIEALDGNLNSTTPGAGKTLTAFSQTDGKVSATFGNISITKSQISDFPTEMTPASHTHGNITNDGKMSGSTASGNTTTSHKFLREDGTWAIPKYTTDTNNAVTLTGNEDNKEYSILLKNTNDTTNETAGVKFGKKTNNLVTVNPSTGTLNAANIYTTITKTNQLMNNNNGAKIRLCDNSLVTTSMNKIGTSEALTASTGDAEWLKVLLKVLCATYTQESAYIYRGTITPNSVGYYEIYIYNTNDIDSNGLPRYSYGTFRKYSNLFYVFGTSDFIFYCTAISQSGHNHNSTYLTAVGYDSTNKKIYYTKNGSNTDIVTFGPSTVGLGNVENTKLSTWTGSSNITTVGTISIGTWHGTKIANDYIANPKVTIAGNEVSLGGSLAASTLTSSLGLSNAMHFIGKATVAITDGGTENPTITGYDFSKKQSGDVIIDKDNSREYVWTLAGAWELLGQDASTTYDSGTAETNKWVARILLNSDRTITATMGELNTSGEWSGNAATAGKLKTVGRLTSLNIDFNNTSYNSKFFITHADASTSTGKPSSNSIIMNLAWDNLNSDKYGALIAIHNSATPHLLIRGCNNGTWDTSWLTVLDSNNSGAGTNNNATLTWNATYTIAKINGTDIKFTTMTKPTYAFTDLTSHPTTLSGYGITDAKIASGVITLGSNTITPVTSITIKTTSPVSGGSDTATTTTGTYTISLANAYGDTKNPYGTKTANYILAGPTSGDAAAPSFRAMVEADLPYTYFRNRSISPATDLSAYTTPGSYFNATGNNTGDNANTGFKHGYGYILAFGKSSNTYEGVLVEINYLGTDIWYRTKYGNNWLDKYLILTSANTITAAQGGTGQSSYTIGDILYASAATTLSKLSGNTTKTRKFLRSVATTAGTAVAPAWDTLTADDIPSITKSKISDFPTEMTPSSHTHGNISNDGKISETEAIGANYRLVIVKPANASTDADKNKVITSSIVFDGSTTTQALTKAGTWVTFNNYSHPTDAGNKHIPSGGSSGQFLKYGDASGTATWSALPTASTSGAGIIQIGTNATNAMAGNTNVNNVFLDAITYTDYTNWRPLIWGNSNNGTEGFTPADTTAGVFAAASLTCLPSTGTIRLMNLKLVGTANSTISYTDGTTAKDMIKFIKGNANGHMIKIGGCACTVIAAGESIGIAPTATSEDLYLLADTTTYVYANANTLANRIGFAVTIDGAIVPMAAENTHDNQQDIGTSSNKWANVYATTFNGALTGNADTATAIQTAGTTALFYRGDNTWSNEILLSGDAAALGIDSNYKIGTAKKDLNFIVSSGTGTALNSGNAGGITWGNGTNVYAGIYYQASSGYGSRLLFGTTGNFSNGAYARIIIHHDGKVELPTNITSNSTSAGSLVIAGGAGIAGKLYVGSTTTVDTLTITNTGVNPHINLSRTGTATPNYINIPASSALGVSVGGATGANIRLQVNNTSVDSWTDNTVDLGTSSVQWKSTHSYKYVVEEKVTLQWNSTDSSLDFVFA